MNQISSFNQLPTELLHILFQYLRTEEILHSFSNLNNRIDSILNFHSAYRVNLQSIGKSHFHLICESIRPEQIISLRLSDDIDTPNQSILFLSYFPIDKFTNLRSISLIRIEFKSLHEIFSKLHNLTRLRSLSFNYPNATAEKLNQFRSTLRHFYTRILPQLEDLSTNCIDCVELIPCSNLRRLDFNGNSCENIKSIVQHAPQLQSITFHGNDFGVFRHIQPCYSLRRLSLTVGFSLLFIDKIEQTLRNFPNLTHFDIKSTHGMNDASMINGHWWQTITQSLTSFNFLFSMIGGITEKILDSFRTPFWLKEKCWLVVGFGNYLCTLTGSAFNLSYFEINHESPIYSTIPNNEIVQEYQFANLPRLISIKTLRLSWKKSLQSLSTIVDLKQIECLIISPSSFHILRDVQRLLPRLHTLELECDDSSSYWFYLFDQIQSIQIKQIRTLRFDFSPYSQEEIYNLSKLSYSFPCVEHIYSWPITSTTDMVDNLNQFKQVSMYTIVQHNSDLLIAQENRRQDMQIENKTPWNDIAMAEDQQKEDILGRSIERHSPQLNASKSAHIVVRF
ncbi:unnamed protein product [Adineta ricciae]|uniref:F-box domain-containing protein n=1 Tax=Adineta ricciae TaxID=249248 RepID=A0A815BF10_ADIRI|nr:unnamed protein product [Adineta ricciae]